MSTKSQEILTKWKEFMARFRSARKAKRRRSHRKKRTRRKKE